MTVFLDLMKFYNGEGVYQPISSAEYQAKGINFTNSIVGGHALEIIGWGRDPNSNLPYWLVKNSWGIDWPKRGMSGVRSSDSTAETGYFKMIMYDGTRPVPQISEGGAPVLTFEATAHAAMFPFPPIRSSGSSSDRSTYPSNPSSSIYPLNPANPLPFSPL